MDKESLEQAKTSPTGDDQVGTYGNALPNGTRLFEFEIKRVLGEGGFGVVYRTFDHSLHRNVAVKEYLPGAYATRRGDHTITVRSLQFKATFEAGLRSFIQEARLLAQFEHPALVKILRFWEANGTAYMAMPEYQGLTLRETLKADPGYANEATLKALASPLLEAVALLHNQQCFHRDISPDNIIIQPNGAPVLLDFGAARRIIGDMTQALTVVLKPGYAPIEQYVEDGGLVQGAWTDVYGLAAVLYTAVAGKPPPAAVARGYKDSLVPLATDPPPGYSLQFLGGIDAGLAVRPEDRPQSIAAFRELLGLTLDDDPQRTVIIARPRADESGAASARTDRRSEPSLQGVPTAGRGERETGPGEVASRATGGREPSLQGVPTAGRGERETGPGDTASPAPRSRWLVSVIAVAVLATVAAVGWVLLSGGVALPFLASPRERMEVASRASPPSDSSRPPAEAPASRADGESTRSSILDQASVSTAGSIPGQSGTAGSQVPVVPGGGPVAAGQVSTTKAADTGTPTTKSGTPPPERKPLETVAALKKDKTKEPPVTTRADRQPGADKPVDARVAKAAPAKAAPEVQIPALPPPADSARPQVRPEPEKSAEIADSMKGLSEDGKRYRIDAERGDATAQALLARMHATGQGAPRSDADAAKWYRKAADQGNAQAQTNLGTMYGAGRGVPKDQAEAVKWYLKAADQGNAQAQANLGIMYSKGVGVAKDETEAAKWSRKAAEQGNATAQTNLGFMYGAGRGVPNDDAEAVRWYRKAAEQGNPVGQTYLGNMYATGRGVAKDDAEALRWYRKATDQGYGDAAERVKVLEQAGRK